MTAARPAAAGSRRRQALELAILLGIIAAAVYLRFVDLNRFGVRGDEAIYSGQAATLAGDPIRAQFFAVFRAHPLLYQSALALLDLAGAPDEAGRWLSATTGVLAVVVAWALGRTIRGPILGLASAALLAVAWYAVSMSRMALLDTSTGVLLGVGMLGAIRYLDTRRAVWLAISAGFVALACLTKEVAGVVLGALLVSQLDPRLRISRNAFVGWTAVFVAVAAAYPVSLVIGHGVRAAYTFLRWQLSGRGLAPADTYVGFIDPYLGWPVAILFVLGLVVSLVRPRGRERLLALAAVVVLAFLQWWRLKEVQLPVIAAPILAVIAGIGILRIGDALAWLADRTRTPAVRTGWLSLAGAATALILTLGVAIPMAAQSQAGLNAIPDITLSTGRGGYPGQREAAIWFRDNAPDGAVCAVAAANLAALVQFYSGHDCVGLNVPAQVRRRNPVDVYVDDGAKWVADNRIQYVITDVISDQSRDALTNELNDIVSQYHGRLVHEVDGVVREGGGVPYVSWLVRIYEVRP